MKTYLRGLTACALALVVFLAGGGVMHARSAGTDYDSLLRFSQVLDLVSQYYVRDITESELIDNALKGMLQNLDPHSDLMGVEEYSQMQETTTGEFFGVGVEITSDNGNVLVVAPIEDTPGHAAGLKSGDLIIAIDGVSTQDYSLNEAATRMRGPRGSAVELTILPKGEQQPVTISILRDAIPVISVKSRELEPGYFWIRLTRFNSRTTLDLQEALRKAQASGEIKGIVLDLRNNPGGLLDQAITVSDLFLHDGVIMSMRGRDPQAARTYRATNQSNDVDAPLVILINGGTASSSEIVAGALRDHNRAILMGERTFGKGSVQNVIPLPDGTGLKLTVALYYTPSGKSIQAEGLVPDVLVPYEPPREDAGVDYWIRESDLTRHLEQGTAAAEEELSEEELAYLEETRAMLAMDNQLRMALQFIKTMPLLQSMSSAR